MSERSPTPAAATPEAPRPVPAPPAPPVASPSAVQEPTKQRGYGKWIVAAVVLVIILAVAIPWWVSTMGIESTDDAYVNGHVTFVAPRVSGQVARVFVDDNNQVHKGDLLLQIDPEPLEARLQSAAAAVDVAETDLVTAQATARSLVAQTRSARFNLETAMQDVDNRIALLRSKVATLQSQKAELDKAQKDYDAAVPLQNTGGVSREEFDLRKEALLVAQARNEEALQEVYQVRVSLGLPAKPETGADLTQVPADLDENFSAVRQAEANLIQQAAQLGVSDSLSKGPRQLVADFYKRDPSGDIDRIYAQLMKDAPNVKQAEAKLAEAQRLRDQATLDVKYCDVVAEIDGVVTRRNVNPGNNVVAGQSLMAIRSLTEIWVDANFKETQLARLRIGQPVDLDVDMYGRHHVFKGRISGFTMGTGSTLALLPAQNATGNFVKVVQRLPVRIDLLDYDPETAPLFLGVSVEPRVHVNETPTGPNAGRILQPYAAPTTRVSDTLPGVTTAPATARAGAAGTQP